MCPILRPAWALADWLGVAPATIRTWYRRGQLEALACDVRTRALLYDYERVLALRDRAATRRNRPAA